MGRSNPRARGAMQALNSRVRAREYDRSEYQNALRPIKDMLILLLRAQVALTQPKKGERLDPAVKQVRADIFKVLKASG